MILIKTALKLLRKNKGQNIFYFVSSFVTSTMVFMLCNMLNNTYYGTLDLERIEFFDPGPYATGNFSTFSFLMFVALGYSLVLNYYTSQVFTNNYRHSITTLLLIGFSSIKASATLLIQYAILTIPAILLSFVLSVHVLTPILDTYIYRIIGCVNPPIGVIYYGTYSIYGALILSIIALFVMVQKGQIESRTISDLLHKRKRSNLNLKNKLMQKIIASNYPLLYIIGIGFCLLKWEAIKIIPMLILGIYSCFGILFFTIPNYVGIIKKKIPSVHNYLVLSNYVVDLKDSFLSCTMLMISVVVSVILICQSNVSQISCIMSVITLSAIVIMVCVSLFSQLYMSIEERQENAYRQFCMGITKKEIISLNTKELVLFFMTLVIIPGIYCLAIIIPSIKYGTLQIAYGVIYMLLLIVPLAITMIITIIIYNNKIRRKLWRF